MGCTLHNHGHSHGGSSGHSHGEVSGGHGHDESHSTHQENINVRAAFIHVISDFVQVCKLQFTRSTHRYHTYICLTLCRVAACLLLPWLFILNLNGVLLIRFAHFCFQFWF